MKLFEIVTTGLGESYVRAYCWAESEARARELFAAKNPDDEISGVRELFADDAAEFCTAASDSGWENQE